MKKYPKTIYVFRENVGDDDEYLGTWESPEDACSLGESRQIAVYELKKIVTVKAEVTVK